MWHPQEALRIYRSLLEDPQTLNTDDINFRIASILTSGPADVQDKSKAIEIYKAIRNREGNKGSSYYWSAAYYLIDNYIGQNQYSEALGLVTEDLNDPEWQFSEELKTIYQNGSDEIREAIDSSEALRSKLP